MLELLTHTAAKGAAVLIVAILVGLALRKLAAARRYAIWITAVGALAVLPFAMALLPAWHVLPKNTTQFEWPVVEPDLPVEMSLGTPKVVETVISHSAVSSHPAPVVPPKSWRFDIFWEELLTWLPTVWLGIAAVMLLRLAWSAWCLRRLERVLKSGNCDVLEKVAREMGLARVPKLLVGDTNAVPMVWGVWRPRLLLPAGFEQWSADRLRGVLLHELAHLKRRDPLALWTAQWVKALHWFNPLAWLTIRQLRADQERACDDAVLRQGVRPSDYAQSLLDLSRHSRIAPGLALCALTITRCAPVEARVKAILDPNRRREPITRRWLACLAGFALLITLPVAMLHAIEGPKLRGRILDRHGVVLAESTPEKVRHYPLKTLAAHTLGYTGKSSTDNPTPQGRAGVEKQNDAVLKSGTDVALTFDMRIQALAHRAMTEAGVTRGAAVVLDPRTGEVLAAVSLPSYDPNLFVPSITHDDWERYIMDTDTPLVNRATHALTSSGSLFVPVTALAAFLDSKQADAYECAPLSRESGGGVKFGAVTKVCGPSLLDGRAHGSLTLEQALTRTCFSYFFQLGDKAGYPALLRMTDHLGLLQDKNIFDDTNMPLLLSEREVAERHSSKRMLLDYTANAAVGGSRPVSPMQMAVVYAALATGKVWEPSILQDGRRKPRADLNDLSGLPDGLARVRAGLQDAVSLTEGRAHAAASSQVSLSALAGVYATGPRGPLSETFNHHHWIAGFAPANEPSLAFVIYADKSTPERTPAQGWLGPVTKRIVEGALALPADGSGEVKPVEDTAWRMPQSRAIREIGKLG